MDVEHIKDHIWFRFHEHKKCVCQNINCEYFPETFYKDRNFDAPEFYPALFIKIICGFGTCSNFIKEEPNIEKSKKFVLECEWKDEFSWKQFIKNPFCICKNKNCDYFSEIYWFSKPFSACKFNIFIGIDLYSNQEFNKLFDKGIIAFIGNTRSRIERPNMWEGMIKIDKDTGKLMWKLS
jgi:hypothetical protein